ncbi:MAG: hypothetical protein K2H64_10520 [Desulfovibrio sp.]|nr:hypothetical protein [Desulfovibrio sp.]
MPQVAARINQDLERLLGEYFRTKSAGAEFILPWAIDTIFRSINDVKDVFSASELKTIAEAYKDAKLTPDTTRLKYLLLRISDACDLNNIHIRNGASKSSLMGKLQTLNDIQAAALMIWASAFWVSKARVSRNLDEYIAQG